ncbi:lysozyme-like protein 6 isoform X1 [Ursus arctos]|uniref:lysozyme-like protein 6 isoform X1 n=1 Tax=Ursus arctos TaxID=9644 RepID=UPI002546AD02|nr:lysozyme-like protein 6 isoform X1 [Ursus arctos]
MRPSEPRALDRTFCPPKMTGALLVSLVSCLIAISQASLINRCDLARVLRKEDLDGFEGYSLNDWLCLAFVESNFNISKVNENADGSFDYGIFQINSHYWCNDYRSHSENICHEDCQGLARAPGWERPTEPQSSLIHHLCKKDCVRSRGDEELGSMEVALCRPATLLLDDRMFLGMRQGTGPLWSHSRALLTREFFISSSSCLHFTLFSFLSIYK